METITLLDWRQSSLDTMELITEATQNLNTELPYDPVNPLQTYIQKKWKWCITELSALHVTCSIIHNGQDNEFI